MLFLREWEEVGDIGVGGGGSGVASVGLEGAEGVVEDDDDEGETASSQVSATAFGVLGLMDADMARFLWGGLSPCWLASLDRSTLVLFTRSARRGCHCCSQGNQGLESTEVSKPSCSYLEMNVGRPLYTESKVHQCDHSRLLDGEKSMRSCEVNERNIGLKTAAKQKRLLNAFSQSRKGYWDCPTFY